MKIMRSFRLSAVAVTVAMLAIPWAASAQEKVRVAYVRTLAIIPQLHAEKMGYMKREGLDTEIISLNSGPAVTSAVVSDSAEIGYVASVPIVAARAQQQPIKVFATPNKEIWPHSLWVSLVASERSGVKTIADLKGKTVAINGATTACDLLYRDHFAKAGMPPDAAKIVTIPFPQVMAALELGNADAGCVTEPFLTLIRESPKVQGRVLAQGIVANLDKLGAIVLDGYFSKEAWIVKNEKIAAGFMRAMSTAYRDLAKDPALYRAYVMKEFKMPEAMAANVPVLLDSGTMVVTTKDFQPLIDAMVRTKILDTSLQASALVHVVVP